MTLDDNIRGNVESLVFDVSEAIRMINRLSPQPDLGLHYTFNFGFDSLVLNVEAAKTYQEFDSDGIRRKKVEFNQDVNSQMAIAQAKDEALFALGEQIVEVAEQGESYRNLVDLLGQLKIKAYKGHAQFDSRIDVAGLLEDVREMDMLARENFRTGINQEGWDDVITHLYGISREYRIGRTLPATVSGKMSLDTIARSIFRGDAPVIVDTESKEYKRAKRLFKFAYAIHGRKDGFDVSPEEGAVDTISYLTDANVPLDSSVVRKIAGLVTQFAIIKESKWYEKKPGIVDVGYAVRGLIQDCGSTLATEQAANFEAMRGKISKRKKDMSKVSLEGLTGLTSLPFIYS